VFNIILKTCRTWVLNHSCKGSNHSFFFLFCASILRCYSMELAHDKIIFGFYDVQIIEKWVKNIINVFTIIFKKCRTWVLNHSCKGSNHNFFFILCFYFEVLFHGTGARYNFFRFFDVQSIEKASHEYH